MAANRYVRKNFNAYVDGKGYAGNVQTFTAPKLTLKTEDFQAGGMFAPTAITFGHEKLQASMEFISDDPDLFAKWTVVEGKSYGFTVREALEDADGTVTAVIHNMRGKVSEIDPGDTSSGEKATTKIALELTYYKKTFGARVVQEIDVVNMVAMQDGVDVLASIRSALGI